ncbi:MAG: NADP-dependent phosphogluconate dehydrogenase, partial [Verrucomicrobiota bacterium]|nr:NADP-dependent phosphogluconate dehydrogenase [Verrucomicrobiota bacterium]
MSDTSSDIGLVGLAVMGQNLALNIADHGFRISVYNRTTSKTDKFVAANPDTPGGVVGATTLEEFVQSIKRPRKIIILVQAGGPTDAVIDGLTELLDPDDIIIDGGNALWTDTIRREKDLNEKGFRFVGSGVSGGEEGARFGPALMPGGKESAWQELKPIWQAIAAKVDEETGKPLEGAEAGKPIEGGVPCATYIGENGAGHYVKMVHNGIEYGDMQMICEAYNLMGNLLGITPGEMSAVFGDWNQGVLDSFLIEITADILGQKDPETGQPFVDIVLDTAGQKGTGKWTSINALDMGIAAPCIAEAVFARCISAIKEERVAASQVITSNLEAFEGDRTEFVQAIHDALYCSKICSYAQGFQLMREAQNEYGWQLDFGQISMIWRGGCIIRARFLQKIFEAYQANPEIANLLLDPYYKSEIDRCQANWRKVVATAALHGIPIPCFSSALSYYDSYRSA